MRQQLKEETPQAKVTNPPPRVSSEQAAQTATVTYSVQKNNKWRGWPFIAIGILLILSASLAFAVSMDYLRDPIEMEMSVDRTVGTDAITNFFIRFSTLAMLSAVASIYILYGLWIRKHGKSGRLPALLAFYVKRAQNATDRHRKFTAWYFRGMAAFIAIGGISSYLSTFLVPPRNLVDVHTIVSVISMVLYFCSLGGLFLIPAEVIYRLRQPNDQDQLATGADHPQRHEL